MRRSGHISREIVHIRVITATRENGCVMSSDRAATLALEGSRHHLCSARRLALADKRIDELDEVLR